MSTPYVALLRGINVGGNNVIKMEALRATFASLGFKDVATLIASGNVVFTSTMTDSRKVEQKIEKALTKEYGYAAKVVVRSFKEYAKMMKTIPKQWGKSPKDRHYVLFLRKSMDRKSVLKEFEVNKEMEELLYVPGALLWCARIDKLTRSRVNRFILNKKVYLEVTIRNLNTTQKLFTMLQSL